MAIFFLPTCSRSCVHDCGPARSLSWITYPRTRWQECVRRLRLREPGSSLRLSPRLLLRTQSLGFPIVAMVYNIVENALGADAGDGFYSPARDIAGRGNGTRQGDGDRGGVGKVCAGGER